jgi:hypothetical protein
MIYFIILSHLNEAPWAYTHGILILKQAKSAEELPYFAKARGESALRHQIGYGVSMTRLH